MRDGTHYNNILYPTLFTLSSEVLIVRNNDAIVNE